MALSFKPMLVLALASMTLLAGCAGQQELGPDEIARVGDTSLTEQDLSPYLKVSERANSWQRTARGEWVRVVYDGPDYQKCGKIQDKLLNEASPGAWSGASEADGREQCASIYKNTIVGTALQQLIMSTWVNRLSSELGVETSDSEIDSYLSDQLAVLSEAAGSQAAFDNWLSSVGRANLRLVAANQVKQKNLIEKLAEPNDEKLYQYYQDHLDLFPNTSYQQAKETIADIVESKTSPSEEFGLARLRSETVCARGYRASFCSNIPLNGQPLVLQTPPSFSSLFNPNDLSELSVDDPASPTDGGAWAADLPENLPEDPRQRAEVVKDNINLVPDTEGQR